MTSDTIINRKTQTSLLRFFSGERPLWHRRHIISLHGKKELNKLTLLPICGFIAQLVEHRTIIAEVTGSNPVEALLFFRLLLSNWRLQWKKGARFFTQNWTLSKTLQILHAVLFRCVKQCSVCFFAEVFFVYEILRMQKSLYLWSHQHMTVKSNFT